MTDPTTDDERTILEFLSLWQTGDVDRILTYFAPDATFGNGANPGYPMPARRGHQEIRDYLEAMYTDRAVRIETRRIGSNADGDVFTERLDHIRRNDRPDRPWEALPIAGVMEMRDGKIVRWREYLDTRVLDDDVYQSPDGLDDRTVAG
jgi:limonene-1,2-epoxide hydrolase